MAELQAQKAEQEILVQSRYLASEARKWLDLFLEDKNWKLSELQNALTYYCRDPNISDKVWKEALEIAQSGKSINSQGFRDFAESMIREQFAAKLADMDVLTQLAAMNPYSQATVGGDWFDERSPQFFLKSFAPWGFGTIKGLPGSGKTDFGCTLIEMAVSDRIKPKPFRVVTNIAITDPPEGVFVTRSFRAVLLKCIHNICEGYLTLVILDELKQFMDKKRAMSRAYVTLEKALMLLRKVGGNLIGILQRPEDEPGVVTAFSVSSWQKLRKDKMIFKRDTETYLVRGVPPTNLKYDTRDIASFVVDVDLDKLHEHIAKLPPSTNQLEEIQKFLESPGTFSITKEMLYQAAFILNIYNVPQTELASIFGVTQGAISIWLSKARDMYGIVQPKKSHSSPSFTDEREKRVQEESRKIIAEQQRLAAVEEAQALVDHQETATESETPETPREDVDRDEGEPRDAPL